LAGSYDTAECAWGVAVSGDYAYVADRGNGLVILRMDASSIGPVHNINKGTDYTTIQDAINDADIGDEIHVDSGTYHENVVVNKQLTLRGIDTGAGMPVVDAGSNGDVIAISANGCLLDGFTATNSGLVEEDAGIEVTSSNNVIRNNAVSNNKAGISLESSSNNILSTNIVSSNSYPGICLTSSDNNILSTNTVNLNAYYGIELYLSSNNTVIDNIANSNTRYGIFVWNSNNDNRMISNTANDNDHAGIRFYASSNNVVSGNSLVDTKSGISMYGSNDNTIFDNNISFNENGIGLDQSINNIIYHNNVIQNTNQASDNLGSDTWDFSYPSGGNHWSDYAGADIKSGPDQDRPGSDGIGDTPYPIPGGSSVDRYPLMAPWTAAPLSGKIAFASFRDGNQEVYVMNADGNGDPINLTNRPDADDGDPTWSPDGTQIAFSSNRGGNWKTYVMNADDGSDQVCLLEDVHNAWGPAWSPDGKKIAVA
ncbi:MAG: right-handed parallel beta-helix repeat-containing protein, partial [Methanosarcinales archaeon]|nr:right-handed parallel beta-helix repeat-containing protein [Methanosarcinales archaeon]